MMARVRYKKDNKFMNIKLPKRAGLTKTFGKIETASAIFWDYLGMFREYVQKDIFF